METPARPCRKTTRPTPGRIRTGVNQLFELTLQENSAGGFYTLNVGDPSAVEI